ncbi:DUF262 domain-containing protein [Micromonospora sp. ALFpr18c]|uniref:DUF262 domain-containing protein n=1 Tax=Micromonospora sp. ALFpr18c TaxID=1458665 RepID=UPI00124B4940|nr:DUF262 domain-containing protein [Micromonospora sp. ALFpr18c]KAB1947573.1 DUF262 domain-containing protein [Micromonospora sp. ALFpr18c]
MLSERGESRLEPAVLHLDAVLDDVGAGVLRVPAFQRPFVWRPEQMLDLFDSVERGYPIGSLLLWETTRQVESLDQVGDVTVDDPPPGQVVSYVLDGHQRISTLFGVLRRLGRPPRPDDQREWKWRIYRDLSPRSDTERYRHHRAAGTPPAPAPDNFLPVRSVANTLDFLNFSRNLEYRVGRDRADRLVREADRVVQRIKGYKLSLITIKGGDLEQAVEVYTRLNRKGVRMDADQVISALTHRPGQRTLANRVDDIVESVATTGFGELPRLAVFRVVLAVADEPDVMTPRWEAMAQRLQNRLVDAVPAAEQAVHRTVEFLISAGLPLARFLPYAHQLVVLAKFFHHCPEPNDDQWFELRRWFWVTSWAGSFAGANSTVLRSALEEMQLFATRRVRLSLDTGAVQPMPDAFNLNSARTLAYVAWETNELPKRSDGMGQEFDVVRLLASGATQAYRSVVAGDSRPANKLVFPTVAGLGVEKSLTDLPADGGGLFDHDPASPYSSAGARRILESHAIPLSAWFRLKEGNGALFVADRTRELEVRLRAFAEEIGFGLGDDLEGVADDDSE